MDLIPKPDQVVAAAGNIAHTLLYGGLADLRPMPRTLIEDGDLWEAYHYRPLAEVESHGDPVLLVTPLAAPSLCFDLRRGCSLVEHLVQGGRPTYLVEYGEVAFRNRSLGMEHWIDEVVPNAIRTASAHAGGRPVHVVGWSLGGIFSMLTAADDPSLPIASVSLVGSPFDVTKVPMMAPVRPLLNLTDGRGALTAAYRLLGGIPKPLVRVAFQTASIHKVVMKPLAKLQNLDDREFLAQIEAVERFTDNMLAYQGRSFGQFYHRFVKKNALAGGSFDLGDRTISLARVKVPVLVFGGAHDGIAPLASVKAVVPLLTGSADVRFEVVPGGHLGMLTGRGARTTTWVTLDEWLDEWSGRDFAGPPKKTARPTKKAPTKKPAAKKTAGKKTAGKSSPRKRTAASAQSIGANPTRRYGSFTRPLPLTPRLS